MSEPGPETGDASAWSRPLVAAFGLGAVAPAIYHVLMVCHGAITVPFADEWALSRLVVASEEGRLRFADLVAPHNEHRPFTSRCLQLALARATRWDIRAEFQLTIACYLLLFALLAWTLWRTAGRRSSPVFAALLAALSLVVFSPGQHNAHWFSFMLALDLAALFSAAGLVAIAIGPTCWSGNVLAAICCWLATYSVANGVVAFLACLVVAQASQPAPLRPNRFAGFWVANTITMALLYFPGLPRSGAAPGLWKLVTFSVTYLGSPLGNLLHFGFVSMWSPASEETPFHFAVGLALLLALGVLGWRGGVHLRTREEDRLVAGFSAFAIGGALATAFGRAGLEEDLASASRFIVFASFLLVAVIFWIAGRAPSIRVSRWRSGLALAVFAAFVLGSARSYRQAIRIYGAAHEFNRLIATAFNTSPELSYADQYLYPNFRKVQGLKRELAEHRLGPYADSVVVPIELPAPPDSRATAPGGRLEEVAGKVEQVRVVGSAGMRFLDAVGWATPSRGPDSLPFVLVEVDDGARRRVVPAGLPVTGYLPFDLPDPAMFPCCGWGLHWDLELPRGAHVLKAYAFYPRVARSEELGPPRTFEWPGE